MVILKIYYFNLINEFLNVFFPSTFTFGPIYDKKINLDFSIKLVSPFKSHLKSRKVANS